MENYHGLVLKSGPCFGIFPQKKKQKTNKHIHCWMSLFGIYLSMDPELVEQV